MKRSKEHKRILKLMVEHDIQQVDIADHLDVTPQAINNRLKRGAVQPIEEAIHELKNN